MLAHAFRHQMSDLPHGSDRPNDTVETQLIQQLSLCEIRRPASVSSM
jgi:hypothetical protein